MAAAAAGTPTGGGDWTVVRRRGRRRGDAPLTASQHDAPPLLPVTPIPWSPSDPSLDWSASPASSRALTPPSPASRPPASTAASSSLNPRSAAASASSPLRRVVEPALFYMPHCEASLYDALLAANWDSPAQLRRVCNLSNSFRRYALQAEDNRSGPAAKASHVLAAARFACEERVGETGDLDVDDWFARAFNETSWHFFEVDDDIDLAASIARGRRQGRIARHHVVSVGQLHPSHTGPSCALCRVPFSRVHRRCLTNISASGQWLPSSVPSLFFAFLCKSSPSASSLQIWCAWPRQLAWVLCLRPLPGLNLSCPAPAPSTMPSYVPSPSSVGCTSWTAALTPVVAGGGLLHGSLVCEVCPSGLAGLGGSDVPGNGEAKQEKAILTSNGHAGERLVFQMGTKINTADVRR